MIGLFNLFLMLIATVLGSLGSLYLKRASGRPLLKNIHKNFDLLFGFSAMGISMIIYLIVLKEEKVSLIYPIASMSYIWTTILSSRYLGEKMNKWKSIGLGFIILGIILLNI